MMNKSRKKIVLFIFVVCVSECCSNNHATYSTRQPYTWKCEDNKCIKTMTNHGSNYPKQSLEVCKLLCGDSIVWPQPQQISIHGPAVYIKYIKCIDTTPENKISDDLKNLINGAVEVFKSRFRYYESKELLFKEEQLLFTIKPTYFIHVKLAIADLTVDNLKLNTKEGYSLTIEEANENLILATIEGDTFFGLRHGLETLSQLIIYDEFERGFVIPKSVVIKDEPAFPYRGLMLDTSRNYYSVESIKRTIDGMSLNKLNSFHWHLTDTHSFPVLLNKYNIFAKYGAYSSTKVYTEKDIESIVEFAKVRGVRVIPELDAPAHVGEGWQWTTNDELLCFNKEPWGSYCGEPPCGQLNPLSNQVYTLISGLYQEYMRLFKPDIFHMGGDEVYLPCWKTSESIRNWINNYNNNTNPSNLNTNPKTDSELDSVTQKAAANKDKEAFQALWIMFQEKALSLLKNANSETKPEAIVWTSDLTKEPNLQKLKDSNYIIQVWTTGHDIIIKKLLEKGFRVILSNYDAMYLDCGYGSWVSGGNNWCKPYKDWKKIYRNDPVPIDELTEEKKKLILGQEATLWSETASEQSLDSKIWPRASALAERVWTNPKTNWKKALSRMLFHRERLQHLGFNADNIGPEWCNQNTGGCEDN